MTEVLFTAAELTDMLGRRVLAARGLLAERVAWGWLKPILGGTDRPEPVSAEVFSWAVELGAIAHENPAGYSSKQLGDSNRAFSAERRAEILDEVRAYVDAQTPSAAAGRPRGNFPPARAYPDPAECY